MSSRREHVIGVFVGLCVVVGSLSVIYVLSSIQRTTSLRQDAAYEEACTRAGGIPTWNGKHWECLK